MIKPLVVPFFLILSLAFTPVHAQQVDPGPGLAQSAPATNPTNRTISFSGAAPGQPDGALPVTFRIYADQQSSTALWNETQTVQITGGKYSTLLGSESPKGIPPELFAAEAAHWLGVEVNGKEQRFLLVSVPYAMKAIDAERFGGLLPSDFVTAQGLQAILRKSAATPLGSAALTGGPAPAQAAAGTPPQLATDFIDNNSSEVLLVTQQGTGFAIHAVSSGDAALFAENSSTTGTAIRGSATATTGTTTGVLGKAASPSGTAGAFESSGGAKILSLRANAAEVGSVDQLGNLNLNGSVQAQNFVGNGFGLTNVPNSATTATPYNFGDTIVARDSFGGFSAGQIFSTNFVGNGLGLTNIPNSATTATPNNFGGTIVARDSFGGFSAGQIFSTNFVGSGLGLTNIPNSATTATPNNFGGTIVARDSFGGFSAGQIFSTNFVGSGIGLTNIPNSATTATPNNFGGTIVARDSFGGFAATQIFAQNFIGNGSGLSNISNSATTATEANTPNAIVARDSSGSFTAGRIQAIGLFADQFLNSGGLVDFSGALNTLPVRALASVNTPLTCTATRELLIKQDAIPGQQLFICNATGNGWVLVGDGSAAGVASISAGDSSISIGGTGITPTISVANGGVTSAKLAANAAAGNILDGTLPPSRITGTAATLGANTFNGNQVVSGNLTAINLTSTVGLSAGSGTVTGNSSSNLFSVTQNGSGVGLSVANSGNPFVPAINSVSQNGDGIDATSTHGSGVWGISTQGIGVQANGVTGVFATGQVTGVNAQSTILNGTAVLMSAGAGGKFLSGTGGPNGLTETFNVDSTGNIFAAGSLSLKLPNNTVFGTFVNELARLDAAGALERTFPTDTSGIIGVVVSGAGFSGSAQVAYSGVANCLFDNAATVDHYVVNSSTTVGFCSDAGLSYPSSGQIIGRVLKSGAASSAVPIFLLGPDVHGFAGGSVAGINTGAGLTGGPITSSGTISIANAGVTNTMLQNSSVTVTAGAGLSGGGAAPLGGSVTLNNTGALSFNGRAGNVVPASGDYSFAQLSGSATAAQLPATIVYNNQANTFTGNQTVNGTVAATALSGDGSAVTGVNAATVGGLAPADLATSASLNSETSARQSADATLQSGINAEAATRLGSDNALQASINAETSARQSDVAGLQTSINNVSAADAKLTASNTFTAGTQDFSGAGATLPVKAVTIAQTPATCSPAKELLIKTDAPAGQQLFICNAAGSGWNLLGDGAAGGVSSFNGRSGSVTPANGDYSFSQISGSVAATQSPALTGDVTSSAGSTVTALAPSGVTAGTYTKVTVDSKGRATSGAQAAFADLSGSVAIAQLPTSVAYNNQANSFTGNQTVTGTVSATNFSGNGSSVTGVNAASLNGLASGSFAQLAAANTFAAKQTLPASTTSAASFNMPAGTAPTAPTAGDVWNTGSVLQYRDNASATRALVSTTQSGGMQLLKLTASITPSSVASSSCAEQTFTVTGLTTTDLLLTVAQPSTTSPGTNIAIGGWRVSATNTVAIQFCNVNRNNASTPASGTYTVAIMR